MSKKRKPTPQQRKFRRQPARPVQQHRQPCGTCPFTSRVAPGAEDESALGFSPPEVFVAQQFMPYLVTCHEHVDYDDPNWKAQASRPDSGIPQCVGFAMCRDSTGHGDYMPDLLLRAEYNCQDVFQDVWDFWAYHKQISRTEALAELIPEEIMRLCLKELRRGSAKTFRADNQQPASAGEFEQQVLAFSAKLVVLAYQTALCRLACESPQPSESPAPPSHQEPEAQ
jgi:hypothetical protein